MTIPFATARLAIPLGGSTLTPMVLQQSQRRAPRPCRVSVPVRPAMAPISPATQQRPALPAMGSPRPTPSRGSRRRQENTRRLMWPMPLCADSVTGTTYNPQPTVHRYQERRIASTIRFATARFAMPGGGPTLTPTVLQQSQRRVSRPFRVSVLVRPATAPISPAPRQRPVLPAMGSPRPTPSRGSRRRHGERQHKRPVIADRPSVIYLILFLAGHRLNPNNRMSRYFAYTP